MAIAHIAGTSKTAIYKRIKRGCKGEALCEGRWSRQKYLRRSSPPRRHVLVCALRIAAKWPDRLPSADEIQQVRPMSKQNAQVWRQALATARAALTEGATK